jgi:5,10-methenyltetrahydromethanopterin hydrogenase
LNWLVLIISARQASRRDAASPVSSRLTRPQGERTTMDEVPTRQHAEAHVKAVLEGDMESITNDFVPDMRDKVQGLAEKLPRPTEDADIEKIDMEEDHAMVQIRYSNERESLAIRTRWEELDGQPMIVAANVVED